MSISNPAAAPPRSANRRRTPALAAVRASCLRAEEDSQWRPAVAPRITHRSAPTGNRRRTAIHGSSCDQAQRSILTSRRPPPLPRRTSSAPRDGSRSVSARSSASPIRRPARHKITIQRPQPNTVGTGAGLADHRDDLLDGGRVRGIPATFVSRGTTFMKAGHRDGRPAVAGKVKQSGLHLPLLLGAPIEPPKSSSRRHARRSPDAGRTQRCPETGDCIGAGGRRSLEIGKNEVHFSMCDGTCFAGRARTGRCQRACSNLSP